jgi:hypothetical protein
VVHKTHTRKVITLAEGQFEAREVERRYGHDSGPSTNGSAVLRSEALAQLVPPGQRYGYDLIVHVGLARCLRNKQREEIRDELRVQPGIKLSAGTVTNLCDRFLSLLEALHLDRVPQLRVAMQEGYPLHIDATCERGRGGLAVCLDGWRGWVLLADRVPSEHHVYLEPLVDATVGLFGNPVAIMRDLGKAIGNSVGSLAKQGIADLLCHYHFVRAVGKKLFEQPYGTLKRSGPHGVIRAQVSSMYRELLLQPQQAVGGEHGPEEAVREDLLALLHWLLEGTGKKPAPYPFELPEMDLVRRCRLFSARAEQWVPHPRSPAERRIIAEVTELVGQLNEPRVIEAFDRTEQAWLALSELRSVLQLTNAELPRDDGTGQQLQLPTVEHLRLSEIEKAVATYRSDLENRVVNEPHNKQRRRPATPDAIILGYLETYDGKLFGHPAWRDQDGRIRAVMNRTNNILEQLFGAHKRRLRRRLGKAHLARDLELQPAQAALVANLLHDDYVRVVCGSLPNLPAAFAEINRDGSAAQATLRGSRHNVLRQRVRKLLQVGTKLVPRHRDSKGLPSSHGGCWQGETTKDWQRQFEEEQRRQHPSGPASTLQSQHDEELGRLVA